jgi:hypothetical protein
MDGDTFWVTENQALKISYNFAWGKDKSSWLDMWGRSGAGAKTLI